MKFSNIFAVVAIAAGAVQALPAPEADVALVEREALKLPNTNKQIKQALKLLNSLDDTISSGVDDVTSLLGVVTSITGILQGII